MAEGIRPAKPVRSVRIRVLTSMLIFMTAGLVIAGSVTYAIQFSVLEDRIDQELLQEVDELKQTAERRQADLGGMDTLEDLLRAATVSEVPSRHESVLAIVNGKPRFRPVEQDFDMSDPGVLSQIEDSFRAGRTIFTTLHVGDEPVRAVIASVSVAGDDNEGIYVVGNEITTQQNQIWRAATTYAGVSLAMLVGAALVGYLVSGRLMRPLADLREATEQITVYDLGRRVPVPHTRDDVRSLADNFNRMLDRIDAGFTEQKRFMSDVSHELRTPLTIIRGTLETTDPDDPDDVREGNAIALDELDRMNGLVGDLSTLAHSSRPDFVTLAPLDLGAFAHKAFARIEHLGERNWQLDSNVSITTLSDENRLMQAIVQMAANAVRYSEEGTTVTLRLREHSEHISISVTDEGIGIAAEDQPHIFERFSRAASAAGKTGSGLGLSIVRAIAVGHGGDASVRSQPGVGSTFTIVIPVIARRPEDLTATEARADDPSAPATDLGDDL